MLKGEKVTLRAPRREDMKRLWELEQANIELVILGYGYWEPRSLEAKEKRFDKHIENEDPTWFMIEADGKVIGDCGLHGIDRREGVAELGIGIYDTEYVGKGYGRDAINVLLKWAFRVQCFRRIWLETSAVNGRAIRAYQACGFVEEGRLRQHVTYDGIHIDLVVMGLLRSEWEAMRQDGLT